MKKCPFCAEEIQDAAIKCRYCGSMLDQPAGAATPVTRPVNSPPPAPPPIAEPVRQKSGSSRRILALLAVVVGFVMTLSTMTVGFGILLLWVGFAFALSGGAIVRWGGGFLASMIVTAIGVNIGLVSTVSSRSTPTSNSSSPTPATLASPPPKPTPPPEPTYQLALIASKGYESSGGGYHIIEGTVRNLSDRSLKNVAAVGIWLDKNGEFITSDDALIDYNPILPGQTSPFKTMSRGNPAMQKYRVEFKTLFGGTLSVDDQRKK